MLRQLIAEKAEKASREIVERLAAALVREMHKPTPGGMGGLSSLVNKQ